jgi:ribonuclease P protein component
MQRRNRLTASVDFLGVRRKGRSFPSPLIVLHARPNEGLPLRLGVSVGKRFGPAVDRNRFKRRIREIVRRRLCRLAPGWDLVLDARSGARTAPFGDLESAVEGTLSRSGVLVAQRGSPGEKGK